MYNVLLVFMMLLLIWATGKVRDRFGAMVRFKDGLKEGSTVEL